MLKNLVMGTPEFDNFVAIKPEVTLADIAFPNPPISSDSIEFFGKLSAEDYQILCARALHVHHGELTRKYEPTAAGEQRQYLPQGLLGELWRNYDYELERTLKVRKISGWLSVGMQLAELTKPYEAVEIENKFDVTVV